MAQIDVDMSAGAELIFQSLKVSVTMFMESPTLGFHLTYKITLNFRPFQGEKSHASYHVFCHRSGCFGDRACIQFKFGAVQNV